MTDVLRLHSDATRQVVGEFLTRVLRLDPAAVVRITGNTVWAWVPRDVLVARTVDAEGPDDSTVSARDLLAGMEQGLAVPLSSGRDADWPGAIPVRTMSELDRVPRAVIDKLLESGRKTFREASASADPQRVGDALLEHEALTVSDGQTSVGVRLGILFALERTGLWRVGDSDGPSEVVVGVTGGWVVVRAGNGAAYHRRVSGLSVIVH